MWSILSIRSGWVHKWFLGWAGDWGEGNGLGAVRRGGSWEGQWWRVTIRAYLFPILHPIPPAD